MKNFNNIWFFDIDDTLIDTASASQFASKGIKEVFKKRFNHSLAQKATCSFNQIFNLMLVGYRAKDNSDWKNLPRGKKAFKSLLHQVETYQVEVKKKYGAVKKWSREVFIKIAADENQITVSPELVQKAAVGYWQTLTQKTSVFPGAKQLFSYLKSKKAPIFLITSSDSRLKMKPSGQFIYDPKYSENLKKNRIELLKNKGIDYWGLSIGDPEDKPSIEFFQKGLKLAARTLGKEVNTQNCIMVGDSYGGDLKTPYKKLDFGAVVLFEKNGPKKLVKKSPRFFATGDLSQLINLEKLVE